MERKFHDTQTSITRTSFNLLLSPIFFLLALIAKLDFVSVFDSIEGMVDYSQACIFSLLGYNLTFPVHTHGSILITGASTSIGGNCATTLAEKGFTVFAGVSQLTDAHKLKGFISPEKQHNLIPVLLDVTKADHIDKALQTVMHHFSSLHEHDRHLIGIVNCVGVPCVGPLETIQSQDWLRIMHANTVGPFQVISTFLPLLRQSVGRVVNLSSANTMTASPMNGVYAASKTV
jgi:NAD(P)-dependent dehydrogenase (short-subunit alcohol dehydrogenase family)